MQAPSRQTTRVSPTAQVVGVETVHAVVPGRVRFRHRGIVAKEDLARAVEEALRQTLGVTSATASPLTGSILVTYAAPISREQLAEIVDAVAAGRPRPQTPHLHALSAAVAPQELSVFGRQWHSLTPSMVAEELATDTILGLEPEEARHRLPPKDATS